MKADTPSPPDTMPSYGVIEKTDDVTDIVLRAMAGSPNARLREVMAAFVRHLHAFAQEVRLTQDEYDFAVDFLNRIGKATTETHNEGILFADAAGFSTLVVLMNSGGKGPTETAAALLGPFWRDNSPLTSNGGSIVRSPTSGSELFANIRVTDPDGRPIQGVEVDVWHSSPDGFYENQDPEQADMNLRGGFIRMKTESFGSALSSPPVTPCRRMAQWGNCCALSIAILTVRHICIFLASSRATRR